ncbi:hypothetical protein [Labedaea rhizosphaerae]|uniref:Uncharacterized protein n=1 Tax=Labedaea rhizosphaerae TaxID=598644 RepID=A0A4R6S2D3_LABRH|nr:hypothetical protein [Labedaea rhizosphaerae]TDP92806.1 hypothetical protein EV186_10721 [Labedaea rhizosphaerae]
MSRDEIDDLDPEQSPGVGTDGSLTSHHQHRDTEEHVGVGTDGSLHSRHGHHDNDEEPEGTEGSLRDPDE